jgi:hypothetical protein
MKYLYAALLTMWTGLVAWFTIAHQKMKARVKGLEAENLALKVANDIKQVESDIHNLPTADVVDRMVDRRSKRDNNPKG